MLQRITLKFPLLSYRTFAKAPQHVLVVTLLSLLLPTLFVLSDSARLWAQGTVIFEVPHEVKRSSMLVMDLTGDDKMEIIIGSEDGYLTVVEGVGYHVIWNQNVADYLQGYSHTRIQAGLAAADLDGDGRIEIVVATGGVDPIEADRPGAVLVFTHVGGDELFELMPGWPVMAFDELGTGSLANRPDGHPDPFHATPSLGDIDGDGDMEIVIGGMDRRMHAFHHDGTYVNGWPLDRNAGINRESRSTAALADLDDDGVLDILVGSNVLNNAACANPYWFLGLRGDGSRLPGFPFLTSQNIESSPAIGDINNDGSLDIVFGTGDFNENCGQQSDGKKVYALDRFGNLLPGWPVTTHTNMINSPALGDLNNDGTPEVVLQTEETLFVWHGDGSVMQGFPVHGEYHHRHAAPVLADVDGDSQVEIVLQSGQVYGPDGQLEQKRNKLQSHVVVADQDGDGLLETIGFNHYDYNRGWHLQGFVFQETGPATGAMPWPMFHRTLDRNGLLPNLFTLTGRIVNENNAGVPDVLITLDSGQTTTTNAQGEYILSNLPKGDYTITPSFEDYSFTPKQQSINVSGNATVPQMVMVAPAYDIQGKVMHASGSPFAGVTVELSTGATQTTGQNGRFNFREQNAGRYTIEPVAPDFDYTPQQRTLRAEEKQTQFFYALPKPLTKALQPDDTTLVQFNDTQSLPTRITFPAGLGEDEAIITPLLVSDPDGYRSAGHTLNIALASGVSTQGDVIGQDGESLAIEIEIRYSVADLQSMLEADELVLLWQSPDGWVDAQATCPAGSAVEHDLQIRSMTVAVCKWGTYGLFAPVNRVFVPSLFSGE